MAIVVAVFVGVWVGAFVGVLVAVFAGAAGDVLTGIFVSVAGILLGATVSVFVKEGTRCGADTVVAAGAIVAGSDLPAGVGFGRLQAESISPLSSRKNSNVILFFI